jgi:hypothetical protein
MDLTQAEILVAKRAGLTVEQDKEDIDAALLGAIGEYGIHIDVPAAQMTESPTIAADANYVPAPLGYSKIKSVIYRYAVGSTYVTVPLVGCEIAGLDRLNEGLEGYQSDSLTAFAVYEGKIYVGPGVAFTGGTIIVRYQVNLDLSHIDAVPNPMALVSGAVANLKTIEDEKGASARKEFIAAWSTEGAAAQPIQQTFSEVRLPDNILADDAFRSQL